MAYVSSKLLLVSGYVPAYVKHLYWVKEGSMVTPSDGLMDPVMWSMGGEEQGYQIVCRVSPVSSVRRVVTPTTFASPIANTLLQPGVYSIGGVNLEYMRVSRSGLMGIGIPDLLSTDIEVLAINRLRAMKLSATYVELGVGTPGQPWS